MQIAELNTRVKIKRYDNTQDQTTGIITPALIAEWVKWVKVEETSEARQLEYAGISFRSAYRITARYEKTRPTLTRYNIEFEGVEMKIASVIKKEIGYAWFEVITAYN